MAWSRCLVVLVIIYFFAVTGMARGEEFYQWVDEKGTVHITNTLDSVPEKYRNHVKSFKMEPMPAPSPSTVKPTPKPTPVAPRPVIPAPLVIKKRKKTPPPIPKSPLLKEKEKIERELALAQEAQKYLNRYGFKYMRPEFVRKYLNPEDLKKIPSYGYAGDTPRVRREDVFYLNKRKIENLKRRLWNLEERIRREEG